MTLTFPAFQRSYAMSRRALRKSDGLLFGITSAPNTRATSRTGTVADVYVRPSVDPHAYRVGLNPSTPATQTATAIRPSTRPPRRGEGMALLTAASVRGQRGRPRPCLRRELVPTDMQMVPMGHVVRHVAPLVPQLPVGRPWGDTAQHAIGAGATTGPVCRVTSAPIACRPNTRDRPGKWCRWDTSYGMSRHWCPDCLSAA